MLLHELEEMQRFERALSDFLPEGLPILTVDAPGDAERMQLCATERGIPEMHGGRDGMQCLVLVKGREAVDELRIAP